MLFLCSYSLSKGNRSFIFSVPEGDDELKGRYCGEKTNVVSQALFLCFPPKALITFLPLSVVPCRVFVSLCYLEQLPPLDWPFAKPTLCKASWCQKPLLYTGHTVGCFFVDTCIHCVCDVFRCCHVNYKPSAMKRKLDFTLCTLYLIQTWT